MKDKNELMRQLVEIAVNAGRKRQSPQTGLVHHFHNAQEGEHHLPVPIFENLLFALALLKSRTMENVAEAKEILDRILHFQHLQEGEVKPGNFPIYLHDYPRCKDRFVGTHVAFALYWILKQFHQILGQALKERTERALKLAIEHALHVSSEKAAPYPLALKIAAIAKAGGALLQRPDLEAIGDEQLNQLQKAPDLTAWMCPASLGTLLIALKTLYPILSNSPWNSFWKHLHHTWHMPTAAYAGPALKVWQQMAEPQPTIYDLFMGYFSGEFSARALKDSPMHLEATLIPFSEDALTESSYPLKETGSLDHAEWIIYQDQHVACSLLQKDANLINPAAERGYHLLYMLWGSKQRAHTLVSPGNDYKKVTYHPIQGGFDMLLELGKAPAEDEEREKTREIAFYGDIHDGFDVLITGEKATTFKLGDEVLFQSEGLKVALTFTLESGEGKFLGHRMFSNRPSQISSKGLLKHEAYDWTLFLRTLQRSENCVIKVAVRIEEVSKE